ncbi:DUF2231 domain-containing protein [Jatrophihabitans fulvus]
MSTINGLPAHVLLVHAVVVLLPLLALAAVAAAVWPAARRRIGVALPVLALVCLVLVPITTNAGEWLEERVGEDQLVERHAELGDGLLLWVALLFVATLVFWLLDRVPAARRDGPGTQAKPRGGLADLAAKPAVRVVVSVVMVALAVVTVVQVIRIGDTGAQAAWHDAYKK